LKPSFTSASIFKAEVASGRDTTTEDLVRTVEGLKIDERRRWIAIAPISELLARRRALPTSYRRDFARAIGSPLPGIGDAGNREAQFCAQELFGGRRQPIAGTIAERYLRAARRYARPLPQTLAFLPPDKREHHPAMIAAFGIPDEPEPGVLRAPRSARGSNEPQGG
jgi:hypothetical protein